MTHMQRVTGDSRWRVALYHYILSHLSLQRMSPDNGLQGTNAVQQVQ
jgi:hypothetical protein